MTICAAQKRPVFGRLENGAVKLNAYGKIVEEEWHRMGRLRENVELDEFIVMPDHFHAIVIIRRGMACHAQNPDAQNPDAQNPDTQKAHEGNMESGMASHAPTGFGKPQAHSLARVVGGFKSAVTRAINLHRAEQNLSPVAVWQRSFYERVIRDEKELIDTRRYIIENPSHVEHP